MSNQLHVIKVNGGDNFFVRIDWAHCVAQYTGDKAAAKKFTTPAKAKAFIRPFMKTGFGVNSFEVVAA